MKKIEPTPDTTGITVTSITLDADGEKIVLEQQIEPRKPFFHTVKSLIYTGGRAMKRIYISGKIAGLPLEEARYNFSQAQLALQEEYDVINPIDIMRCDAFDWADYIIRDLMYLRHCDAIYMLRNWRDSPGAVVEHAFAQGLGLEFIYEEAEERG